MNLHKLFSKELKGKMKEAQKLLVNIMEDPHRSAPVDALFRIFHTLKGSSSVVGFRNFQKIFHELEDIVKAWRGTGADPKIAARMSEILDLISNKTADITENDIEAIHEILRGRSAVREEKSYEYSAEYKSLLEEMMDYTVEIESALKSEKLEMVELILKSLKKKLFTLYESMEYVPMENIVEGLDKFVIRDATELNKKAKLNIRVEGAKVQRADAQTLRDCLIQMVRNAVVHGIEEPETRKKLGKNEVGTVTIEARIEGNHLILIIEDDGEGLDIEKIKAKASQLGITETDPFEVIFYPEFSTLDSTNVKGGRGIGLDAVKNFVELKEGEIRVESEMGRFTRFIIKLPLEKYLKKLLVVRRGKAIFGIELNDVSHITHEFEVFTDKNDIFVDDGSGAYNLKDISDNSFEIVAVAKGVAIAIDEILGIRETSIRKLSVSIPGIKGVAMGIEEFPIPIISPTELPLGKRKDKTVKKVLVVDDSPLTRLVVKKLWKSSNMRSSEQLIFRKPWKA